MESELDIVARFSTRAPVDLDAMFEQLGIEYDEEPINTGESGWIERDQDNYRVVVNSKEPEPRRRFTAAHELAHYLLHRDLMNHNARMNRHTDRLFDEAHSFGSPHITHKHEVQANQWAAMIVMPADLVRQEHAKNNSLAFLAKLFRVSKRAMEIRLDTLGLAAAP